MAITASNILDRVKKKLNDLSAIRWPDAEHIEAINDAQQAILEARPDLFETYAGKNLVQGVSQDAPADCFILFDVLGNCSGSDALISPITYVSRSTLDRHMHDWMSHDADADAIHWTQDNRERKKFFVYPPQPAVSPGRVYLRYAKRPTAVTSGASTLSVPDECLNAIYHFCMTRALEKDEKFSGSPQAASYMEKFALFIGARSEGEMQADAYRAAREDIA